MIIFASRTGNVRYIISKLNVRAIEMTPTIHITEPFLLFTYTDGLGNVPPIVEQFMAQYGQFCRGVIASGNRNFGHAKFATAGDILAEVYKIPLIHKIDLRGTTTDYAIVQAFYDKLFSKNVCSSV